MGESKQKDKKKKQHHHEKQSDPDEFEKVNKNNNDDDDDIVVENETKKIKNKVKKKKETLDVKIQTVHASSDKISPVVGYFPTSYDPIKESSVDVYQNVKRSNRYEVVVRANGFNNINFVGTNYSGEAAAPQLCTYALGLLDKHTQTLNILPIAANKIFRLEPNFGESDATQDEAQQNLKDEAQQNLKDEVNREERFQNLRLLDNMYSTKKTTTKNKKLDSLRQKQDPRSKMDLEKSLEDVKVNTESLAAGSTNARNIPFHDMSASTPEKAYPLEKIIEKGEWDYLSDLLNISRGVEVTPDAYPIFVCNRVHKLKDIKDEYEKSTVASVLQYITHLIKYKDKHSMDHYKSVKNHKFPSLLEEKFRTMFNEPGSKRLSAGKGKFLISHVLVLTLFVDGYRSDVSDIAKDLKINVFDLRKHYAELGCKLVREKSTLFATLPVPLTFPVQRQKKRKR